MSSLLPTFTYTCKQEDFSISASGTLKQIQRIDDTVILEVYKIFLKLKKTHKKTCRFNDVEHTKYVITFGQKKSIPSEKINSNGTVEVRILSHKLTELPKEWIFLRD